MFGWKTIENFLGQWYHVKRWRKFCAENNSGKKDFPAISPRRCVHVYIINKWVARAIWAFLKNLQEQINFALNSKPCDITETKFDFFLQYTWIRWTESTPAVLFLFLISFYNTLK